MMVVGGGDDDCDDAGDDDCDDAGDGDISDDGHFYRI